MNHSNSLVLVAASLSLCVFSIQSPVVGQGATLTYSTTQPTPAAIEADPVLQGATVYDFFTSTIDDILLIVFDTLEPTGSGQLYRDTIFDNDSAPISPLLVPVYPAIEFDSYVTTPSSGTATVAGALPCGSGPTTPVLDENGASDYCEAVWFDSTDEGPQEDFHFARFTVIGDGGLSLDGTLKIDAEGIPTFRDIPFTISGRGNALTGATLIPEPATGQIAVLCGIFMFGAFRRRRNPVSSKRRTR